MNPEEPAKSGVLKTTGVAISIAIGLLLFYVLSSGPVTKLVTSVDCLKPGKHFVDELYFPLGYAAHRCQPFQKLILWYVLDVWQVKP